MVFDGLLSAVDVVEFRQGVVGFFLVVRAFVLQVVVMAVGGVLGLRGLVLDGNLDEKVSDRVLYDILIQAGRVVDLRSDLVFSIKDWEPIVKYFIDFPLLLGEINNLCLVGKVFNPKPFNVTAITNICTSAWKTRAPFSVVPWGVNIFLFRFEEIEDKNEILKEGPWSMMNSLMVLKPLMEGSVVSDLVFSHCPFWVQIHGLPVEKMTRANAEIIGKRFGKLLALETSPEGFFSVVVFFEIGHDNRGCRFVQRGGDASSGYGPELRTGRVRKSEIPIEEIRQQVDEAEIRVAQLLSRRPVIQSSEDDARVTGTSVERVMTPFFQQDHPSPDGLGVPHSSDLVDVLLGTGVNDPHATEPTDSPKSSLSEPSLSNLAYLITDTLSPPNSPPVLTQPNPSNPPLISSLNATLSPTRITNSQTMDIALASVFNTLAIKRKANDSGEDTGRSKILRLCAPNPNPLPPGPKPRPTRTCRKVGKKRSNSSIVVQREALLSNFSADDAQLCDVSIKQDYECLGDDFSPLPFEVVGGSKEVAQSYSVDGKGLVAGPKQPPRQC
ncbi:hypothetical protein RHGRI_007108 [Rhododendron griersonianum]|uniref:DUF4283 domain-containing protein n=1 Tax=Rhododendron griersonianum TaxID=479676 RepID=A0AAV6KWE4_9ERIC|nr:hypothetical protein RHGRI_007108 [Rhododendron griersonianum]